MNIEDKLALPLDIEREAWEASQHRFLIGGGRVEKVKIYRPSIYASFLTGTSVETIYASTAVGTAKNTFTTEAVVNDTAGMGPQPIIPPYFWMPSGAVAKSIRIVARGIFSTTSTCTWQWFARLGGANSTGGPNIGSTAALTSVSGAATQLWEFEVDVSMVTLGATGGNSTVRGIGLLNSPGGITVPYNAAIFGGGASPGTVATVDISITNYVNFDVACGTSNALNTITVQQLLIFGLN